MALASRWKAGKMERKVHVCVCRWIFSKHHFSRQRVLLCALESRHEG